jgi:plastocyanin
MRTATALGRLAAATTVAAAVVTACGSSAKPAGGATSTTGAAATASTITIKSFQFSPANATVKAGSTLTVVNDDGAAHTVTSSGGTTPFDSGTVQGGASGTVTAPTTPGTYAYICSIHNTMHGTLTVVP